jgi:hypothetical protein
MSKLSEPGQGATAIRWWSQFEPTGDVSEEQAATMVRGIYEAGIQGLKKTLAG